MNGPTEEASPDAGSEPARLSRRRLLQWGAVGGGIMAAGTALGPLPLAAAGPVADRNAPAELELPPGASALSAQSAESGSFEGDHQLAVLSQPTPATAMVAFDVLVTNRSELRDLLRTLTDRMRLLYSGGAPASAGLAAPSEDTGILGPQVPSHSVAFVFGMGASLFDERYGLSPGRPTGLLPMGSFPNDDLDPSQCQGDLSLQICANDSDTVVHALRDITKQTKGAMQVRWRVDGFKSPPRPAGTPRNLMGFKDGIANPPTVSPSAMEDLIWVQSLTPELAWTVGGTFQVVRIIRMLVETWDDLSVDKQQAVVGRQRDSGAPLGASSEFATPDYASDPQGLVIPLNAHIRLANPRTAATAPNQILRRGYNYDRGVDAGGYLDQGLIFTCYQQDILKQFITVQTRLVNEPMAAFVSPVGGGYFFCPPGLKGDSSAYFGSGLL